MSGDGGVEAMPLLRRIRDELRRRDERWTAQRERIIAALLAMRHHVSVDELVDAVRSRMPHCSAATVYRTLSMLVETGIVRRIAIDGQPGRYEIAEGQRPHHHLLHVDDRTVEEFQDRSLDRALARVLAARGLELVGNGLEISVRRITPPPRTANSG